MKLLRLFLLACLTHCMSSTLEAQEVEGTRFLRGCGAAVKQQDGASISEQEMVESLWCIGYVQGFTDSISITQSISSGGRKAICLPQQGIANDQGVRIFVKYLRDNPQVLHESGRTSLY